MDDPFVHLDGEHIEKTANFLKEIEKNLPIQQIYIDKSNESISEDEEDKDTRRKDVLNLAITMVDSIKSFHIKTTSQAIQDLMNSEPFCNYKSIKDELLNYYKDEVEQ